MLRCFRRRPTSRQTWRPLKLNLRRRWQRRHPRPPNRTEACLHDAPRRWSAAMFKKCTSRLAVRTRWRFGSTFCVVIIAFLLAAAYSEAQNPTSQPTTILSGQVELARLVDLCAERLGLKIEYDASVLKGVVTLRLGESVTDAELWRLTNQILAARGFASVQPPDGKS